MNEVDLSEVDQAPEVGWGNGKVTKKQKELFQSQGITPPSVKIPGTQDKVPGEIDRPGQTPPSIVGSGCCGLSRRLWWLGCTIFFQSGLQFSRTFLNNVSLTTLPGRPLRQSLTGP